MLIDGRMGGEHYQQYVFTEDYLKALNDINYMGIFASKWKIIGLQLVFILKVNGILK